VHALFEFLERLRRRSQDGHPLVVIRPHPGPDSLVTSLVAVGATAIVLIGAATGFAQRPFFGGYSREPAVVKPTYDGRFTSRV
jgi:hypothetical protein